MGCQKWLCLCAPIFLTYFWWSRWCVRCINRFKPVNQSWKNALRAKIILLYTCINQHFSDFFYSSQWTQFLLHNWLKNLVWIVGRGKKDDENGWVLSSKHGNIGYGVSSLWIYVFSFHQSAGNSKTTTKHQISAKFFSFCRNLKRARLSFVFSNCNKKKKNIGWYLVSCSWLLVTGWAMKEAMKSKRF